MGGQSCPGQRYLVTLCVGCGLAITDAVDRLAAKHSDQHSGDVRPPDSNVEGARVSLREAGTLPLLYCALGPGIFRVGVRNR